MSNSFALWKLREFQYEETDTVSLLMVSDGRQPVKME
jgi:hypothetical protein